MPALAAAAAAAAAASELHCLAVMGVCTYWECAEGFGGGGWGTTGTCMAVEMIRVGIIAWKKERVDLSAVGAALVAGFVVGAVGFGDLEVREISFLESLL